MKVHPAGNNQYSEIWVYISSFFKRALLSFHYINENHFWKKTIKLMKQENDKVELFLDSGAFSAWTQGLKINIDEYIQFIKKHEHLIHIYANLDVIGIGGKQPNELTAKKTLENQKIMEKAGLHPIPCFHFGEPDEYLMNYVNNYPYIALGVAGNSGVKLRGWLDRCFSKYICDKKGIPKVKVHGFAVTSVYLMTRYPWYSVDSTSWVMTGRMGGIFVPIWKNGKWMYNGNSWKIAVSNRSPNLKEKMKHILTIKENERKIVLSYIEEKGYQLGHSKFVSVKSSHILKEGERWAEKIDNKKATRFLEIIESPGISNMYQLRDEMNIIYFKDLEQSMPQWPWSFKTTNSLNII